MASVGLTRITINLVDEIITGTRGNGNRECTWGSANILNGFFFSSEWEVSHDSSDLNLSAGSRARHQV
jgi:hypothetical protein